jgi:hypothetical protein
MSHVPFRKAGTPERIARSRSGRVSTGAAVGVTIARPRTRVFFLPRIVRAKWLVASARTIPPTATIPTRLHTNSASNGIAASL